MSRDRLLSENLDWALLDTFRVIVEEGRLSRAALRLKLTQSAVSHSLKRLESHV
ncbi:MAG: LysR family transcriptional regulator [Deltaproteobacteria bacterium]|jgi:DNA-binding transcriptional LysR family regulator|nr:LysR family transcriptional regulator [Deltaproteobacteria bacterium]